MLEQNVAGITRGCSSTSSIKIGDVQEYVKEENFITELEEICPGMEKISDEDLTDWTR